MGMFLRRGSAPSLGTPIGSLDVGSIVKLNVNGTPWEFLTVHQGLPSSLYDASCDGTWLLMKDIYEKRVWNSSNVSTYANSDINTYLGGDFLAKFDSNVQNAIKQVKIPYCAGGGGSTVNSGANGLSCRIFLLGATEIGLSGIGYPDDGAKLDYFNANTGSDSKRIAYLNGSATIWWLRFPYTGSSSYVWFVVSNGNRYYNDASSSYGIRPAFILPSDFLVTDDMLA